MIKLPSIKICGVTEPKMAEYIAELKINYLGLVFTPNSCRYISLEKAKKIIKILESSQTIAIGVFAEESEETILNVCQDTGLSMVQLHGYRSRLASSQLPSRLNQIYAIDLTKNENLNSSTHQNFVCDRNFLLFDGENPGSGNFIWSDCSYQSKINEMLENVSLTLKNLRYFLAGGININNVEHVIKTYQPFGIDISSGVESQRGIKDRKKIYDLVKTVRSLS